MKISVEQPSESVLLQLRDLIEAETGLYFPEVRLRFLKETLKEIVTTSHINSYSELLHLLNNPRTKAEHILLLSRLLTIGETYFFRDEMVFRQLENVILPELIRQKQHSKTLSIWSAGCSSGEELYSIAFLMEKVIPGIDSWNISLTGTDINPDALEKAKEGIYSSWSFRNSPAWVQNTCFTKVGKKHYRVREPFRNRVSFYRHNLKKASFAPEEVGIADLILCRNVLMYFQGHTAASVVKMFYQSLTEQGWFIVSPIEGSLVDPHMFVNDSASGMYAFRKQFDAHPLATPVHIPIARPIHTDPAYEIQPFVHDAGIGSGQHGYTLPIQAAINLSAARILHNQHVTDEKTSIDSSERKIHGTEVTANTQSETPSLAMAQALADKGEWTEALYCCTEAIEKARTDPAAYHLRAIIYLEMGRLPEAMEDLRRVLFLDPDNVSALFLAGNLAKHSGDSTRASTCFNTMLKLIADADDNDQVVGMEGFSAGNVRTIIHEFLVRG